MHVHLPKPLHGWRAFAGEVGIIVVGVLIALAAEQTVQAVHERSIAREARNNVIAEIEQDMDVFRRRAQIQPCIDRRLDEIEQLIRAAPAPLPRPLWIGRPQVWEMYTQRWNTASVGGRTSLLTLDQQSSFAVIYSRFAATEQMQQIEQQAWARLRGLEILPRLDPAAAKDMVEALEEARYANWRIKTNGLQLAALARKPGYKTGELGLQAGSRSVCVPLHTSRADALKSVAATKGALFGFEP
jgi:type II secretory pathway pseudopilin PulG